MFAFWYIREKKTCHAYIELYLMPEIIMGTIWHIRIIGPLRKKRIDYDSCHISRNNEKKVATIA